MSTPSIQVSQALTGTVEEPEGGEAATGAATGAAEVEDAAQPSCASGASPDLLHVAFPDDTSAGATQQT